MVNFTLNYLRLFYQNIFDENLHLEMSLFDPSEFLNSALMPEITKNTIPENNYKSKKVFTKY